MDTAARSTGQWTSGGRSRLRSIGCARVNRVVLEDLERSVRAMRDLRERLSDAPLGTFAPQVRPPSKAVSFG